MNIPKVKALFILSFLMFLTGCANTKYYLEQIPSVPPLFRTVECINYDYEDPFSGGLCQEQVQSIVDTGKTKDEIYSQVCNVSNNQNANVKECAAYLMRRSDHICNGHLSGIFADKAFANTAFGILAAGTGIAGGLVPGVGAANALSGVAGLLTGSRSLFNEEVYRNYVSEAIIKEILANRKNIAAEIDSKTDTSSNNLLGVEQIKQKVSEYHNACSFYAGLTSLLGKAGQTNSSSPTQIASLDKRINELSRAIDNSGSNENLKKRLVEEKAALEHLRFILSYTAK